MKKAKAKASKAQADYLVAVYDKITCLEKTAQQLASKELETLSAEIYNAVVPVLNPKRRVLLNELLDIEVELRVRNTAEAE